MSDPRRRIPAVDQLLSADAMAPLVAAWGRARVATALRGIQAGLRAALEAGQAPATGSERAEWYAARVEERLRAESRPSLRRVINATGVVLHTNLGRAPLPEVARRAIEAAAGYGSLELNLETGDRGSRDDHCVALIRELTGAEAALVVNNNAAAVVLAVNTLAAGRDVLVSRGELVEIGGSFRVPEIIERSGARLREVGATNRTHARDYEDAAGPETGLILRVHRSNFRLEGFTAEVPPAALAGLAGAAGLPLVHDLGSGLLMDLEPFGLPPEPTARRALEEGADVVTMSGDKLLGGPQAGLLLGRADLVERMRANPLRRALRPDKLTLAGLAATLDLYRDPDRARSEIPVLAMLTAPVDLLRGRAERLAAALEEAGIAAAVVESTSAVGGGALPGVELPTAAVAARPGPAGADEAARRLRLGDPPVVVRVREGALLLDPRTVRPEEEPELVRALAAALAAEAVPGTGTGR